MRTAALLILLALGIGGCGTERVESPSRAHPDVVRELHRLRTFEQNLKNVLRIAEQNHRRSMEIAQRLSKADDPTWKHHAEMARKQGKRATEIQAMLRKIEEKIAALDRSK